MGRVAKPVVACGGQVKTVLVTSSIDVVHVKSHTLPPSLPPSLALIDLFPSYHAGRCELAIEI